MLGRSTWLEWFVEACCRPGHSACLQGTTIMPFFRRLTILSVGATGLFTFLACSDDTTGTGGSGTTSTSAANSSASAGTTGAGGDPSTTSATSASASASTGTGGISARSRGYYFAVDTVANTWTVTVVDPTAPKPVVATLVVDELAALTGAAGNKMGPGWGDSIASPKGDRVFANAANADRTLVIETATPSVETVLKVGGKPLHIYNPNDNGEIWAHNDTDGSFSVINTTTLAVAAPVVASLKNTGHGKLVYGSQLGTKYFATNTNDPGGFSLDATTHAATFLSLCAKPCVDDPATPVDESLSKCGGTHDKAYNPKTNQIVFQCSGVTNGTVAFVDGTTGAVVKDLVPIVLGGFAKTHDNKYILAFDNGTDAVKVWDTAAAGHDGIKFDATATIKGAASVRGTSFLDNAQGEVEAWIPESTGPKLVVLNLKTLAQTEIEIGTLSPPPGSTSVTRRGEIAGDWYYTNSDTALVMVNVKTKAVVQTALPSGSIQRVNGAMVP